MSASAIPFAEKALPQMSRPPNASLAMMWLCAVDEPAYLARGVRALERLPGDADPGVGRGPGDRIPPVSAGGGTGRGHEGRGQHEEEKRDDPEVPSCAVRGHYARPSVAELS
ncbi:hypothetical protein GCM10023238_39590 [Streptomyces heliomycini]